MKTTIELPDEIFHKAKILAAERRTTMKDMFVLALQRFMQAPSGVEETQRQAKGAKLLEALQASNTEPMVPLKRGKITTARSRRVDLFNHQPRPCFHGCSSLH